MKLNRTTTLLSLLTTIALATPTVAQGPTFESPGLSSYTTRGQTTRFSTEFNPAFGVVIDTFADGLDTDMGEDGFDATMRLIELNLSAFVDPSVWAYIVVSSEELEEVSFEEAAFEYVGFDGNSTIKGGLFFVDFGKQMQNHLEELRTLERPLVLREFLGEELNGTGLQWDHWLPIADDMPLRFSLGVFADLTGGGHGHDEDEAEPESSVGERKDFDELSFTGRLTAMKDVGTSSTLQVGASARIVPEFSFEFDGVPEQTGLSNEIYGADVTFGWNDETGNRGFLAGGEALFFSGDLAAELDDPVTPTVINVVDDDAFGYYAFADYQWNRTSSAGVQFSWIEEPEDPTADVSELDAYYTHHFTEFRRLRLGVTLTEGDVDEMRAYVQFTNFFGSHAHGLNW